MGERGGVFNLRDRVGPRPAGGGGWGGYTTFADHSLDPVCRDPSPCSPVATFRMCLKPPVSKLPTQPHFPVPPAGRLMSWLHRGLMGMPEPPGEAEKLRREGLWHQCLQGPGGPRIAKD